MYTIISKWIVTAVLLAVVGVVGFATFRIVTYEQDVNATLLAGKADYFERLAAKSENIDRSNRPNFVIILFDDLGFSDLGVYGAQSVSTPHIDQLAREGTRLSKYYSPSAVCSPSRAGLLTGRYPTRTTLDHVTFPPNSFGDLVSKFQGRGIRLPEDEITIAEALRASGYATGLFGKWHLGEASPSLPNDFGFAEFVGVKHSNDMVPLNLWHNEDIIEETPVDQTKLTQTYTDAAIAFIETNKDKPFFAYIPHTFPHVPLHPSAEGKGQSRAGEYGDVVEDLDRSVGAVMATLDRLGLSENTFVIVTSDNGPWYQGDPGPNRGRKGYTLEGGMNVPFIARWPGVIPAGVSRDAPDDMAIGMDIFSTVLELAGVEPPSDRIIDGKNLMPMLSTAAPSPHRWIYYNLSGETRGVRSIRYKLLNKRSHPIGEDIVIGPKLGPWLIDLSIDPHESYDVSMKYPDIADELQRTLDAFDTVLKTNHRGVLQ